VTEVEIKRMSKDLGVSEAELTYQLAKTGLIPVDEDLAQMLIVSPHCKEMPRGALEDLVCKLSQSPKCRVRTVRQYVNRDWIDVFVRLRIARD